MGSQIPPPYPLWWREGSVLRFFFQEQLCMEVAERVPAEARLFSRCRETSRALCCSADVLLLRCASEMKSGAGKHASFCTSFLGSLVLLLKLQCLNSCLPPFRTGSG